VDDDKAFFHCPDGRPCEKFPLIFGLQAVYGRGPEQAGEGDRPAGVQQHAAGQGGAPAAPVPADESELAEGVTSSGDVIRRRVDPGEGISTGCIRLEEVFRRRPYKAEAPVT
jgi:hypothetical protein